MCPRFLRNVCFVKCLIKLIDFYQITTVDTVKRQYCLYYGFSFSVLKSIHSYLTSSKRRTKIYY